MIMNKIKKGNLNYDQSGRAYPDNPELSENWDCIWENDGKYYELVGDDQHKEWEEVNIYNQIIDEAYKNYVKKVMEGLKNWDVSPPTSAFPDHKEVFINKIKTNDKFSEKWGLKIEERELSWENRSKLLSTEQFHEFGFLSPFTDVIINLYLNQQNIPTKLITITYNNETIEVYE